MTDFLRSLFLQQDASWGLVSLEFAAVFILFFAILILLRSRRSIMMAYVVAFSLFFAYKASGTLMLLLPATLLLSWFATRGMSRLRGIPRRIALALTVIAEFAPLAYYKYADFTLLTLNHLLETNFQPLDMLLPVGISFYTFQAVSYSVDVYRGRFPSTTPLLEYSFYLTFFPLLMAGPITRAETLIPQLHQPNANAQCSMLNAQGLYLILLGILKKVVVADYVAQFTNWVFDSPTDYSGFENLMAVMGYTLQIFCDFSGYSDVAIGLAAIMGFQLKELPLPLPVPQPYRVLAALAHRPLHMVPRLPIHPPRRQPPRTASHVPGMSRHHARRRTLARSFLAFCTVGRHARRRAHRPQSMQALARCHTQYRMGARTLMAAHLRIRHAGMGLFPQHKRRKRLPPAFAYCRRF